MPICPNCGHNIISRPSPSITLKKPKSSRAGYLMLLLNSINGFLFGMNCKHVFWGRQIGGMWSLVIIFIQFILFIFLCVFYYKISIKSEAKRRLLTNPITSFDQKFHMYASLILIFLLGLPFMWIGYAYF